MADDAWKLPASHAVRVFARRCAEHPRLADDPECVIATERERMLAEIEAAEAVPEEVKPAPVVRVGHLNGRGKRKSVA